MAAVRRGRTGAHGGDRGRDRRPPVARCAIRAAKAAASRCRKKACRSRSARAASCAKAPRSRILSFGTRLAECLKAADELAAHGLSTTVADARFAKPLDIDLILRLAREHEVLLTIEEGSIGGFGSFTSCRRSPSTACSTAACKVRSMVLPDVFIDHDSPNAMYAQRRARRQGASSPRCSPRWVRICAAKSSSWRKGP